MAQLPPVHPRRRKSGCLRHEGALCSLRCAVKRHDVQWMCVAGRKEGVENWAIRELVLTSLTTRNHHLRRV